MQTQPRTPASELPGVRARPSLPESLANTCAGRDRWTEEPGGKRQQAEVLERRQNRFRGETNTGSLLSWEGGSEELPLASPLGPALGLHIKRAAESPSHTPPSPHRRV